MGKRNQTLFFLVAFSIFGQSYAIEESNLPLINISSFLYEGAFRITPASGNLDFSLGIIEYNPVNHSLFVESNLSIGEFAIPEVVDIEDVFALNATTEDLQPLAPIFASNSDFNTDGLDRVTGMKVISGNLVINAVTYYDGNADNTKTTIILDDATDIANSVKDKFIAVDGAAHAAGWISDIPNNHKSLFGDSSYVFGFASTYAINSRNSIGPSVFLVDKTELLSANSSVPSTPLVDYDISNYLSIDDPAVADLPWAYYGYNTTLLTNTPNGTSEAALDGQGNVITVGNDLWTELSTARYGFMIPSTRSYIVLGRSGGHESGIGYKIERADGKCGGPCPYDPADIFNYYWLWDINDFVKVLNGDLLPHEVRPYDYGKFYTPFQFDRDTKEPAFYEIGGATYDAGNSDLYVTLQNRGRAGNFDAPPMFLKYHVDITLPRPPTNLTIVAD
jgi:hypothetical protein